jgi:hypothetical protein
MDDRSRANGYDGYMVWCPGCECAHVFYTVNAPGKPTWKFNGNVEKPTFEPSMLVTWQEGEERKQHVCHSFVRDGQIQFLADCTHKLAAQTLNLEAF